MNPDILESLCTIYGVPRPAEPYVWQRDGSTVQVDLGEITHDGATVLALSPGHADLKIAGRLSLRIDERGSTIASSLWVGPGKIELGLDLVMLEDEALAVRLPGEREPAELAADVTTPGLRRLRQRAAIFEFELSESTPLLALELRDLVPTEAIPRLIWPQVDSMVAKFAGLRLNELNGPLFEDLGASLTNARLFVENPTVTVLPAAMGGDPAGVIINGLGLQLDTPGGAVKLTMGQLELDSRLRLRTSAAFSFELERSVDIAPTDAAFSLVLHGGHRYQLVLEGGLYRLTVDGQDQIPAASVYVPRLDDAARKRIAAAWSDDGEGVGNRFVLDVLPVEDRPAIEVGPAGVQLIAKARRRPISLGELDDVMVVGGELELRGGRWALAVDASASLPWLAGAAGRIEVRGGSGIPGGISFGASFRVALGSTWTDPSGCLLLRNPAAWVSIEWKNSKWSVTGALSGSLEFGRAALVGHAAEWVGEIFKGLSVDFHGLSLSGLSDLANDLDEKVSIQLALARGFRCRLWELMRFDLRGLRLHRAGIGFEGDVDFNLGPLRLGGRLPALRLRLSKGKVELDTGDSAPLAITGALELPSGVRAQLDVRREDRHGVTMLAGRGSLTVPSLPDAEVLIELGRFGEPGHYKPTIAIYGEVATVIHVLPGVVLRQLGVGLGVYRSLSGAAELSRSSGAQLLESLASGTPLSPGSGKDWRHDPNTFLTLVARGMATATAGSSKDIDYYVADVLLTMDSKLRFAGWMNAWMLSSLDDARKNDEIRSYPHARGAFVFKPRVPSIVAAYRTLPNGRSSLARRAGAMAQAVSCVVSRSQTQMLFEANPSLLHLRLGPHSYSESLGELGTVEATSTLAVRVERKRALAILQTRWAARLSGGFKAETGAVAFGVDASAGFEVDLTLNGGLRDSTFAVYGRGRARAWFRVEAWARISIRISVRVKLGRWLKFGWSVRIETKDVRLSLGVEAMVDLEVALGSKGVGAKAKATIQVSIAGITAKGTIASLPFNEAVLGAGRRLVAEIN